ncbi:MAG: site-specific integrase [Pseudomonadota bacterium]
MSIKAPRLIRDRCGVCYFRLIVPLSWRNTVKKTEIRRSLRTKDVSIARQAALLLSAQMEAFMAGNKNAKALPPMPDDLLSFLQSSNEAYKINVRVFKNGDAHIEADTLEEAKEARAIVAELKRGNHGTVQEAMAALPSSRSGTHLEQAKEDYLVERSATLSEKGTIPKIKGVLKAFIAFAGNVDVAMVQPTLVKDYKKKLLAEKKAPTTINDHLVVLTGFFDYCIDNKVASMTNPARGLLIPGAHNKAESYEPFKLAEVQKIFQPELYVKKMKLPDFYWGPLVGLFTGARAEEIASLDLDQIYTDGGIWIIDILDGKTANAVRKVPVHEQLLALGFVDYVQCLQKAGYKKLFPHLQDGKNGYKKNMCRMFGEYLDLPEVNIVDPLKVFHSFRHTVVTKLTGKGVNEGLKRAMVGHDIDTKTSAHDDYTHLDALTVENLQTAINKLTFEGVDFGKLKLPPNAFLPAIAKRIEQQKMKTSKALPTL